MNTFIRTNADTSKTTKYKKSYKDAIDVSNTQVNNGAYTSHSMSRLFRPIVYVDRTKFCFFSAMRIVARFLCDKSFAAVD